MEQVTLEILAIAELGPSLQCSSCGYMASSNMEYFAHLHHRHMKVSGLEAAFEDEETTQTPAIHPRVPLHGNPRNAGQRRKRILTTKLFAGDASGSGDVLSSSVDDDVPLFAGDASGRGDVLSSSVDDDVLPFAGDASGRGDVLASSVDDDVLPFVGDASGRGDVLSMSVDDDVPLFAGDASGRGDVLASSVDDDVLPFASDASGRGDDPPCVEDKVCFSNLDDEPFFADLGEFFQTLDAGNPSCTEDQFVLHGPVDGKPLFLDAGGLLGSDADSFFYDWGVDDCGVGLFCAEEVDTVRVSDGHAGDNEPLSAVLDESIPVDDGGNRDDVLGRNGQRDGSEGVPRRVDLLRSDDENDPS